MCILTPTDFYTTVLHPSFIQLNVEADEMIKKGWKPIGGPFVTPSGKFAQSFCKDYVEPVKTTPAKKSKK